MVPLAIDIRYPYFSRPVPATKANSGNRDSLSITLHADITIHTWAMERFPRWAAEGSNRRTPTPALEDMISGDWRSEVTREMRDQVILKMIDFLTKNWPVHHPPDLNKLKDIAAAFEDKIYADAFSKDDYILKINLKLHLVANTDQVRMTESSSDKHPFVAAKSSTDSGVLDSTEVLTSPIDWQEEIFQKIKSMKDSYLPELIELNRKIILRVQQERGEKSAKCLEQYVILGSFIKSMIKFLQSSKSDVQSDWKNDLLEYKKAIESILASNGRTPAQLQRFSSYIRRRHGAGAAW